MSINSEVVPALFLALAEMRPMYDRINAHPTLTGLPWRVECERSKGYLYGGGGRENRGALIAEGTLGSFDELRLVAAAMNILPLLMAQADASQVFVVDRQTKRSKIDALSEIGQALALRLYGIERQGNPYAFTMPEECPPLYLDLVTNLLAKPQHLALIYRMLGRIIGDDKAG